MKDNGTKLLFTSRTAARNVRKTRRVCRGNSVDNRKKMVIRKRKEKNTIKKWKKKKKEFIAMTKNGYNLIGWSNYNLESVL